MRRRSAALALATLLMLLAGAGAVSAYDHARQDRIARGVTVNGVPVGGLDAAQAEAKLRAALLAPLQRPVRVRHGDRRFRLTAARAGVGIDVAGSVRTALERSRDGSILARTWRSLRGTPLHADVPAEVHYDPGAVRRLVARVRRAVERPARDAALDLSHGQVAPTPSRDGLRVRARALRAAVTRTLLDPGPRRALRVRTAVVHPKVTTDALAARYPAVLIVNRGAFRLQLYKGLKLAKTYGIAVGRVGLETPAGLYHVQNKAVDPDWHVPNSDWAGDLAGRVIPGGSPENPIKARWMGIYDGAGIHGTSEDASIGSAASHGCIRMHIPDVEELYDQVPVGAPVYIA